MDKQFAFTKLAEAAAALGSVATVTDGELVIDGQKLSFNVEISEMRAKADLYSRSPGKLIGHAVKVGAYGRRSERTRLPQKSDGTHSWERGAEVLIALARQRNATAQRNAGVAANVDLVKELRTELGVKEYYGPLQITPSHDADKPVTLEIKLTTYCTPDRAREIHAALAAAGLLE